jgi:transposase
MRSWHTRANEELSGRIEAVLAPFRLARDLLVSIPGVSQRVIEIIIAEIGADMSVFPTAAHLASWEQ